MAYPHQSMAPERYAARAAVGSLDLLTIRRCAFCDRQMATACLAIITIRPPATAKDRTERDLLLCTDCKSSFEAMARRTIEIALDRCTEHASVHEIDAMLSRLEWCDKASASYAAGDRQVCCQGCGAWFWPWELIGSLDLHSVAAAEARLP